MWVTWSRQAKGQRDGHSMLLTEPCIPRTQQKDGFIHLSTSHQTPATLQRFFSASSGIGDELYLVALPRANIPDAVNKLKFEQAIGTEFGHIYGVRIVCCPTLLVHTSECTDGRCTWC